VIEKSVVVAYTLFGGSAM